MYMFCKCIIYVELLLKVFGKIPKGQRTKCVFVEFVCILNLWQMSSYDAPSLCCCLFFPSYIFCDGVFSTSWHKWMVIVLNVETNEAIQPKAKVSQTGVLESDRQTSSCCVHKRHSSKFYILHEQFQFLDILCIYFRCCLPDISSVTCNSSFPFPSFCGFPWVPWVLKLHVLQFLSKIFVFIHKKFIGAVGFVRDYGCITILIKFPRLCLIYFQ